MISAIVLAAGLSKRMEGTHKLLAPIDGVPMIRRSVGCLLDAGLADIVVVIGHRSDDVQDALRGLSVRFVHNPNFAGGMGWSLASGAAKVSPAAEAVLVCLGDMPLIAPRTISRLLAGFEGDQHSIHVPIFEGKRGHPVLFGRSYLPALMRLSGDTGARGIMRAAGAYVREVPVDDPGVVLDFDTPEQLAALVAGP